MAQLGALLRCAGCWLSPPPSRTVRPPCCPGPSVDQPMSRWCAGPPRSRASPPPRRSRWVRGSRPVQAR